MHGRRKSVLDWCFKCIPFERAVVAVILLYPPSGVLMVRESTILKTHQHIGRRAFS